MGRKNRKVYLIIAYLHTVYFCSLKVFHTFVLSFSLRMDNILANLELSNIFQVKTTTKSRIRPRPVDGMGSRIFFEDTQSVTSQSSGGYIFPDKRAPRNKIRVRKKRKKSAEVRERGYVFEGSPAPKVVEVFLRFSRFYLSLFLSASARTLFSLAISRGRRGEARKGGIEFRDSRLAGYTRQSWKPLVDAQESLLREKREKMEK